MKLIFLNEGQYSKADLEAFKQANPIWKVSDTYQQQLEELWNIEHPSAKLSRDYQLQLQKYLESTTVDSEVMGNWVYYPWSGILAHILTKDQFSKVRTNRNKNIVDQTEQETLADFTVGFLGLSIGNGMAINVVYSGISNTIKIADHDSLDLSNLNRIRAGVPLLGERKVDITAQQIFEVNPYATIECFDSGINSNNIESFFTEGGKPKLIFEAIDDFEMKIRIRLTARKYRVPVIMLTNLGDRLLIDVERYDLEPDLEIFNGLIGSVASEILEKPISENDKQKYAIAIVGKENIPQRVLETLGEINKTLVGRPQIMSTVTIGSGVAAYLARRIALGQTLPSGRSLIELEKIIS